MCHPSLRKILLPVRGIVVKEIVIVDAYVMPCTCLRFFVIKGGACVTNCVVFCSHLPRNCTSSCWASQVATSAAHEAGTTKCAAGCQADPAPSSSKDTSPPSPSPPAHISCTAAAHSSPAARTYRTVCFFLFMFLRGNPFVINIFYFIRGLSLVHAPRRVRDQG
jgi:hypothetical protein